MHGDVADCYNNALEICPKLKSLHLTLKKDDFVRLKDLEAAIIQNIKKY